MNRALLVFVGGGIGACLRALIATWLAGWSRTLPGPILLINLIGAFLLGIVTVLADEAGVLSVEARIFLGVGVMGGFTTFSTFGWGADLLLNQRGSWGPAAVYLIASAVGGLAAAQAGIAAGRLIDAAWELNGAAHRAGEAAEEDEDEVSA